MRASAKVLGPDGKEREPKFIFAGANGTAKKIIGPSGQIQYGIDTRAFQNKAKKAAARLTAVQGVTEQAKFEAAAKGG